MNASSQEQDIVQFLSNSLVPLSLKNVCHVSMTLIQAASKDQVTTALEYNKHKINTLLTQLLALNFIIQNQNEIHNDINNILISAEASTLTHDSKATTESASQTLQSLEHYCERKLLSLSPIAGFSRKNYFIERNISDDIQTEIISYLKPIEIFKNISLVNKQFNKNVTTLHQSYRHANVFCDQNYVFQSWEEIEYLWISITDVLMFDLAMVVGYVGM